MELVVVVTLLGTEELVLGGDVLERKSILGIIDSLGGAAVSRITR